MEPHKEQRLWATVLEQLRVPLPLPKRLDQSNLDWYLDLFVPVLAFFGCITGVPASPHATAPIKWLQTTEHHSEVIAGSCRGTDILEDISGACFMAVASKHYVNRSNQDSKRHGLLTKKDKQITSVKITNLMRSYN